MLRNKKIILGVCGSIAAYKSAELLRLLTKSGAEVKVIMTHAAHNFISPLTFSTLSNHPVLTEFVTSETGEWNNHVTLGLWADLILIAPASANTMSKLAIGICDNLLSATYLSARCPVIFAPAMDMDMYSHPATTKAMQTLTSVGNSFIEAEHGELASGLIGKGRMAEPEHIIDYLISHVGKTHDLSGKKIMITAGPTYEAIDPVRFIGNHSSGKMGIAIAQAACNRGADVSLIIGPTTLPLESINGSVTRVTSADEMFRACKAIFKKQDIAIFAAAVADYAPAESNDQKTKKAEDTMSLALAKTVDIAETLGSLKSNQFMVGFALETENELENAKQKLKNKNFDLIVLNSLNDAGAGFQHDTNKISIIDKQNNIRDFELKDKVEVANDIIHEIISHL